MLRQASVGVETFVSGPSFLGLARPSVEVDDSREAEMESGRWRGRGALIILLVTGLIVVYRFRQEGNSWHGLWDGHKLESFTPTPSNSSMVNSSPAKNQNAEVAQPASLPGHVDGGGTGLPQPDLPAAPNEDRQPVPAAATLSQPAATRQPAPVQRSDEGEHPVLSTASTRQDELVAEGEKYLYGKGVSQNCDQARTNLFVAAGQSNAEAQAALGTMFATGHCVARDLPAAFRWFARAERKQPNNPRIEGDLRLLWKEMTSEEQNAAARSPR